MFKALNFLLAFVLNIIHGSSTPSWLVLDFLLLVCFFIQFSNFLFGAGFPGRRLVPRLCPYRFWFITLLDMEIGTLCDGPLIEVPFHN